eukprot:g12430.t1
MARNLEKQKHSLNKYWDHRKALEKDGYGPLLSERRPRNSSQIDSVKECRKWWNNLKWELSQKIVRIQNATLPEAEIRDLNDDINKLLKERDYWALRIRELSGDESFGATNDSAAVLDGKELYSHSGYKYFGAAKELPGVRELFEQQQQDAHQRKTRKEIYANILPDYYGWRDENDLELLLEEQAAEARIKEQRRIAYNQREYQYEGAFAGAGGGVRTAGLTSSTYGGLGVGGNSVGGTGTSANLSLVHTPSDDEIQRLLLEKKRALALEKVRKYISKEDLEKNDEAKTLMANNSSGIIGGGGGGGEGASPEYWSLLLYDVGLDPGASIDIRLSLKGTSSRASLLTSAAAAASPQEDPVPAPVAPLSCFVMLITHDQWVNWNEDEPFSLPDGELSSYLQANWRAPLVFSPTSSASSTAAGFSEDLSFRAKFRLPRTAGRGSVLGPDRYHLGILNPSKVKLAGIAGTIEVVNPNSRLPLQQQHLPQVYHYWMWGNFASAVCAFLLYCTVWRWRSTTISRDGAVYRAAESLM